MSQNDRSAGLPEAQLAAYGAPDWLAGRDRILFEHAADALVLLDRQRRVLAMNPAAAALTGYDGALGFHCGDLFGCRAEDGCELSSAQCIGLAALTQKQSQPHVEYVIRNRQGQSIPVAVSYSYLPGPNGEPMLLMAMRDLREKKRLEREVREHVATVATLRERERLARDFHDTLAQTLAYLNLKLQAVERSLRLEEHGRALRELNEVAEGIARAYMDVRQALVDLRAPIGADLAATLRALVEETAERAGLTAVIDWPEGVQLNISPGAAAQVLRVVQEALANVRNHARASRVALRLWRHKGTSWEEGEVCLSIEDNGVGFDLNAGRQVRGHFGLRSMEERTRAAGGRLRIETAPGKGTKVVMCLGQPPGENDRAADANSPEGT